MSRKPSRVVIVGRDAALWLAAAAIRQALGPAGVTVTAVELPTRLGPQSIHASLPPLEALHAKLGLDEALLLRTTGGSFSLGYNVRNPAPAAPFFLAHGSYGAPIGGGDFFPYWVKARRFGLGAAFEDFCPTAMAARHGRMLLPDQETEAFGRTDYAYHLPAIPYAALLKARASRLGVTIIQALAVAVDRDAEDGSLRSVRPDGGEPIAGDLFIDASGSDAVLIGAALAVPEEGWRAFFPHDRRIVARGRPFPSVPAYAELRAAAAGWVALHACPAGTHVVHGFASGEQGDAAALAGVAAGLGFALDDAAAAPIRPALRSRAWAANCIAIGTAACAFDPLFDVELHAAQLGIVHLLSLFPADGRHEAERTEYNRVTRSLFERIRDFQLAFYALAGEPSRNGIPESLAHKIETFRARGIVAPMDDETFAPDLWRALFVGMGLIPESWPPAIDATPPDQIKEGFRRILGFVRTKVLAQPTHDAYLAGLAANEAA